MAHAAARAPPANAGRSASPCRGRGECACAPCRGFDASTSRPERAGRCPVDIGHEVVRAAAGAGDRGILSRTPAASPFSRRAAAAAFPAVAEQHGQAVGDRSAHDAGAVAIDAYAGRFTGRIRATTSAPCPFEPAGSRKEAARRLIFPTASGSSPVEKPTLKLSNGTALTARARGDDGARRARPAVGNDPFRELGSDPLFMFGKESDLTHFYQRRIGG